MVHVFVCLSPCYCLWVLAGSVIGVHFVFNTGAEGFYVFKPLVVLRGMLCPGWQIFARAYRLVTIVNLKLWKRSRQYRG